VAAPTAADCSARQDRWSTPSRCRSSCPLILFLWLSGEDLPPECGRSARCRHFAFNPVFPAMATLRRVKLRKTNVPENRVTGVSFQLSVRGGWTLLSVAMAWKTGLKAKWRHLADLPHSGGRSSPDTHIIVPLPKAPGNFSLYGWYNTLHLELKAVTLHTRHGRCTGTQPLRT
jgi:hypothetical protein